MRTQEAHRRIKNLLWNRYIVKKELKSKTLEDIKADLLKISGALDALYEKSMLDEKRYNKEHGYSIDDRSGIETYAYESLESIKDNLEYISDRFNCAFRLRWAIDLIDIEEYSEAA